MSDFGDMGWSTHISNTESECEDACREAALRDGYTIEQADNCENGCLNCSTCPWNK